MSKSRLLIGLQICIVLFAGSNSAWAHRFSLGIVIPMSGTQLDLGRQVLDGFKLATEEQDGHAFEESDGHLGGLDSYVFTIDSANGQGEMRERLAVVLEQEETIFLTGIFTVETKILIMRQLENKRAVLVDPVDSNLWHVANVSPNKLTTMDGGEFSAAFRDRYGYAPNLHAMRGYIAARLIAETVRSLTENQLRDSALLAKTLLRVKRELR